MSRSKFWGIIGVVAIGLTASQAWGGTVFGSKFTHQLTPPEVCNNSKKGNLCTWVLEEAQKNVGRERAPKAGKIIQLRLVACAPGGSFVLQIVRRSGSNKARAIRTGPLINYKGTNRNCTASKNFDIEEFDISPGVPVSTGDSIAVVATRVAFMYNASSGPSILYDPPLPDGGPLRASNNNSGFLMFQVELDD